MNKVSEEVYLTDNDERLDFAQYPMTYSPGLKSKLLFRLSLAFHALALTVKDTFGFKESMDNIYPLKIALDIIVWLLVCLPIVILHLWVEPYNRGFYCNDESIRYPLKDNTVTTAMLISVGLAIPLITIFVVEAYRTFYFEPVLLGRKTEARYIGKSRSCHPYFVRIYYYSGYFLFGAAISQLFTDIGKYSIGRLRPHFVAACSPALNPNECTHYAYLTTVCTGSDVGVIREARLSFPSGHASFSFYCMTFTVLYLQAQVLWPMCSKLVKSTVQCIFIALATLTALSRVSDYKHHWSDVFAGAALGVFVATITCVSFVGLFRFPKQQISMNGIVAPDFKTLQYLLKEEQFKNVQPPTIPLANI